MVSVASFISATAVAVVGCLTTQVQAHGYMLIPLTEFKGTATGAWIVQISPQFNANWESVADDTELIALYLEKAKEAGYANNIRKLLDSDTNLYGADCGFSNPDAKPKDPPTDGTATFERGLAHHGPCEIWLDDTMVLHNDDCAKAFSVEDYMSIKSVFKPIDYSSCSSSGCMFRFYWLAFQGSTGGKYVWQIYKNCIPLTGPGAGKASTASTSSSSNSTAQMFEAPSTNNVTPTETPMAGSPSTPSPGTQVQQTPMAESSNANAPVPQATQTPLATDTNTNGQETTAPMATMSPTWLSAPSNRDDIPNTAPPNAAVQMPPVTNPPVWTNAPAPETVQATVAPFTPNQETQNPVWTATNTPSSYSFNGGNQATNAPETGGEAQTSTGTTAPSFSF